MFPVKFAARNAETYNKLHNIIIIQATMTNHLRDKIMGRLRFTYTDTRAYSESLIEGEGVGAALFTLGDVIKL